MDLLGELLTDCSPGTEGRTAAEVAAHLYRGCVNVAQREGYETSEICVIVYSPSRRYGGRHITKALCHESGRWYWDSKIARDSYTAQPRGVGFFRVERDEHPFVWRLSPDESFRLKCDLRGVVKEEGEAWRVNVCDWRLREIPLNLRKNPHNTREHKFGDLYDRISTNSRVIY